MSTKSLLIAILSIIFASQILICFPNASASYSSNQDLSEINVDNVTHTVELLEGGLVVINDTVTVSANKNVSTNFQLGFPYDYAPYLVKCFASFNGKEIPVKLDYGLGIPGFYGVLINLTSLGDEFKIDPTPKNFTVTFIFSELIKVEDNSLTLNFTLFPSLPIDAKICNTTVIFPSSLSLVEASFTYNDTKVEGNKRYYYLSLAPLKKFAYDEAKAWLRLSGTFTYAEIEKLERKIEIDVHGGINVRDVYHIINKGTSDIDEITVFFPKEGYSFIVEDSAGIKVSKVKKTDLERNKLDIPSVGPNERNVFSLVYKLNSTAVLSKNGDKYKLNMSISKITPLLIRELTISFIAPQGISFEPQMNVYSLASSIKRDFSKDIITFTLRDFTMFDFDKFQVEIAYKTNVFWASYPYTLITLVASAVILLGFFARRKPGPAPTVTPKIVVSPKVFRKFVEGYEERIKIISKLDRLEEQMRRGRISRRQYKVRKTMLENKLSSLSKDLADLRETIRRSGPRYADIIRQLEIAEAQLEEAEAGIRRVRSRYRRGEISREAYRRLLEEHEKRVDEANLKIEGALLRLREEYS